jgi:DNA mismatch repair protein MutL
MQIHLLDTDTINKIAAGEVVERPLNVAKELIENAIDAGATAITCEIRDGGISLLRVTDNGCGIEPDQIARAFQRHATSKIEDEKDLNHLETLGFRGEALSSIAAVAQVEMITKVRSSLTGIHATNTGLNPTDTDVIPLELTEIGAPDGTTVIVRNLFYNVPVRRKFLKSAQTETGYITELLEHMALSHPDISFHFRAGNKEKLHTSGNGNIKELIYRIYGKEISDAVLPISDAMQAVPSGEIRMTGFIGKPETSRGTRGFELFFVNGRVIENEILSRSLESGYRTDLMQHQFPFAVLYLTMDPSLVDVNVHPSKKEARFADNQALYDFIDGAVHSVLHGSALIPKATLQLDREIRKETAAEKSASLQDKSEPFEPVRRAEQGEPVAVPGTPRETAAPAAAETPDSSTGKDKEDDFFDDRRTRIVPEALSDGSADYAASNKAPAKEASVTAPKETAPAKDASVTAPIETAPDNAAPDSAQQIMSSLQAGQYRLLGQIFKTYWLVAFDDKLLMIDQHAAHEKVRYERLMKQYRERQNEPAPSQMMMPPSVITFSGKEEAVFLQYQDVFTAMGYQIEPFGGNAYAIRAVPMELFGSQPEALLRDTLDEIMESKLSGDPQDILSRIATASCKAAVKGNRPLSEAEAKALIDELLTLDNPYHCPHGRPTMIELSEADIERRFKRIVG